jgi:hypothetical protein
MNAIASQDSSSIPALLQDQSAILVQIKDLAHEVALCGAYAHPLSQGQRAAPPFLIELTALHIIERLLHLIQDCGDKSASVYASSQLCRQGG